MHKLNLRPGGSSKKTKSVSKLDDHVERSGIDNQDNFIDPTTNVVYHKLKTLGKGGFAKVYQCRRGPPFHETDDDVALKIIPKSRVSKQSQRDKIDAEIQIQRNIDHPHIVKLLHSFEDGIKICLVVELCGRKSLTTLMKNKGPIPQPEVARIGLQIVSALKYIHERGIVHRDLKLGNILLTSTGTAKLADFGLAMYYANATPGNICGTPNFIPPEVLMDKVHSPQSDIWALGCVMCTLLTGKPAFEFTNMKDTYKRILKLQYNLPNTISSEASDLVKRILVADPQKRLNHREIMAHEMIQGCKIEPRSSRHRSSDSALQPVTNLKRRMSETDDVFNPSSSRTTKREYENREDGNLASSRTGKKEYENRLSARRISEDEAFKAPAANYRPNPFVDNRQQSIFGIPRAAPTPSPLASHNQPVANQVTNNTYAMLIGQNPNMTYQMVRQDYNQHVMEARRVLWVTKWVDYSNRLGFGYMLSDGKIGAVMAPPSRSYIVLHRNGRDIDDYSEASNRKSTFDNLLPVPRECERHHKVLMYFKNYMTERLCSGAHSANALSEVAAQETRSVRLLTFKSFQKAYENGDERSNAMAMMLTNDTVQLNFVEISTKMVVHQPFSIDDAVIILIDSSRAIQVFEMKDMHLFPPTEMPKLNSVHKIFHALHPNLACITGTEHLLHARFQSSNSSNVYGSVLCKLCSNSRQV